MGSKYRYILITFFFLVIISLTIPLIVYNIKNSNPELYSIRIEGNVLEITTYTYEDIIDGKFGLVEDQEFVFLNQYNTQFDVVYTGVSVWAILTYAEIMLPNSTGIYFKSYDSYYTEPLTLENIENYSDLVLIAFKKENQVLKYNDDDGGPLRAIVNLSVTEPDYCSKYWAKYVNTIVVV
ncbi:MAG: molybdopterin-dependent oxidoreductase [Promethearchaeota archaeon]